jgi:hypothetical protein
MKNAGKQFKKVLRFSFMIIASSVLLQSFSTIKNKTVVFVENIQIEINKNGQFKGKDLEALYTAKCTNKKEKSTRIFEIIKTDIKLKNYFMVEFVLIEKVNSSQRLYYPVGWETDRIVSDDLRSYCISILKGKIPPIDINNNTNRCCCGF